MNTTVTTNLTLSYNQILSLATQLSDKERYNLCRDLAKGWRTSELRAIRNSMPDCELTDEEIRRECEIVRQQIYDEQHAC